MTNIPSPSVIPFQLTLPRVILSLLWLGFTIYAFGFAPPDQPQTLDLIRRLVIGQWQGIDGYVVGLFNLMGVLPAIYAAVLCTEGKGQRVPTGVFVALSFFVGAFAMIPYLILREPQLQFRDSDVDLSENRASGHNQSSQNSWWEKAFGGKFTGVILLIITSYFIYYGLQQGNLSNFLGLWQKDRFIHVMGWDFCLLNLLLPLVIRDDLSRRNCAPRNWLWWIIGLPLLGPLVYLCVRPKIAHDKG